MQTHRQTHTHTDTHTVTDATNHPTHTSATTSVDNDFFNDSDHAAIAASSWHQQLVEVPAHPGSPGQNTYSHKMVVGLVVVADVDGAFY